MAAAAAVVVVVSLSALLPGALRVRRRALVLRARAVEARREVEVGLALLREQRAETEALLVPWRGLLRWARHPLVTATFDWYRRRRRTRR